MNDEAESFRQATMRLLRMQLNSITVMDLLAFGGAALGIVVTLVQFSNGLVSFAGAFTIVFLSAEFFIPMRSLGSLFHTAMNGMAAADVLLLDEPTTFLDIRYQLDLLELMCQLNREAGITVIMVLHDINQAIRYSDEVVALADGTVAAQGDPREVITSELLERVYGIALQVVHIQGHPHVLTTRTEDAVRRDKVNSAGGDRDPKVESSECAPTTRTTALRPADGSPKQTECPAGNLNSKTDIVRCENEGKDPTMNAPAKCTCAPSPSATDVTAPNPAAEASRGKRRFRPVWATFGFLAFALAMVGMALPILPTTPFMLIAAFCFARSSERLDNWFKGTALYRKVLEGYVTKRAMTMKAKLSIIVPVTILLTIGFVLMANVPVGRIALALVWLGHIAYFGFVVKTDRAGKTAD